MLDIFVGESGDRLVIIHSASRTYRGKECFPVMTISYALIQMVEEIAERSSHQLVLRS